MPGDVGNIVEDDRTDVPTWVKPEQVDRLLDAIHRASPDYLQLRDEALVTLTYDVGLRAAEAVELNTEDVRLEDDEPYLFLREEIQKGDSGRDTPITLRPALGTARTLRHYLRDRWKGGEALFPSRSSPRMSTQAFRNLMHKLAREAELVPYRNEDNVPIGRVVDGDLVGWPHVHPHSLRHGLFYREFVQDERRLKEVSLRLRHKNVSTTEEFYANHIRV